MKKLTQQRLKSHRYRFQLRTELLGTYLLRTDRLGKEYIQAHSTDHRTCLGECTEAMRSHQRVHQSDTNRWNTWDCRSHQRCLALALLAHLTCKEVHHSGSDRRARASVWVREATASASDRRTRLPSGTRADSRYHSSPCHGSF